MTRCVLLLICLLCTATAVVADQGRRLLVDTQDFTLTVFQGNQRLLTLYDLAIGRFGTNTEKRQGDNTTPLGRFRVTRIDRRSGFHRFIGLSYPDLPRAEKALRDDTISKRQYDAIRSAHKRQAVPPQDTTLGGHIGIHGLGHADPEIHAAMNWTQGCIAVTNEQVDALLPFLAIGMLVEVR